MRLGGRQVEYAVGGAWHTVIWTSTGDSYVMGCILPAGKLETANNFCIDCFGLKSTYR